MAYFKIKIDNSPEGKKKNFRIGIILILLIMAVNIIPYIYTHSEFGMIREARSRYNCINSRTSGYYEYLEKYPNGKYAKEATTILNSENVKAPNTNQDSWSRIPITHITGEPTGKYILAKDFTMTSPRGINGGKWTARIKKYENKNEWYLDFCPQKGMDLYKDNGNFLMLTFKQYGSKIGEKNIRLEFVEHLGYKFPTSFNSQLDSWVRDSAKVKFIGFTSDNPHETEFVDTPDGQARRKGTTWIYNCDPEFTIQF